jgi:hypothetical protein
MQEARRMKINKRNGNKGTIQYHFQLSLPHFGNKQEKLELFHYMVLIRLSIKSVLLLQYHTCQIPTQHTVIQYLHHIYT